MKLLGIVFFLAVIMGSAFASAPIVTVTAPALNALVHNPTTITFTVQDTDYVSGNTYTANFFHDIDNDAASKTDIALAINLASICTITDFSNPQTCNYTWNSNFPADGTAYVNVEVNDGTETGNDYSDSFTIDNTLPVISNTAPANGSFTNSNSPVISFTASDAESGIDFSDSTKITLTVDGSAVSYTNDGAGNITYTLTNHSDASVPVIATAIDKAGNSSTASWSFTIDTIAPTNGSNSLPAYTSSATPSIAVSATGAGEMKFSCNNSTYSAYVGYGTPYSGFSITTGEGCASGEGSKTVYVIYRDAAGNETTNYPASTVYDNTSPGAPTNLSVTTSSDSATVNWNAPSDNLSGITSYRIYRNTSNDAGGATEVGSSSSTSFTNNSLGTGTYYFFVAAIDGAGNLGGKSSASSSVTIGSSSDSSSSSSSIDEVECAYDVILSINQTDSALNITTSTSNGKFYNGSLKARFGTDKTATIGTFTSVATYNASVPIDGKTGTFTVSVFAEDIAGTLCNGAKTITLAAPSSSTSLDEDQEKIAVPLQTSSSGSDIELSMDKFSIALSLDQLTAFLQKNEFKTDKIPTMTAEISSLLQQNNFQRSGQIVEETVNGETRYNIKITLSFTNSSNHSSVQLIEEIPKSIALSASRIASSAPFQIIQEDPVIRFDLDNLQPGQAVEVTYWLKDTVSKEQAAILQNSAKIDFITPTLLIGTQSGSSLTGLIGLGTNIILALVIIALVAGAVIGARKMNDTGTGKEWLSKSSGVAQYNVQRLLGLNTQPNRRRVVQEEVKFKKWGMKDN